MTGCLFGLFGLVLLAGGAALFLSGLFSHDLSWIIGGALVVMFGMSVLNAAVDD